MPFLHNKEKTTIIYIIFSCIYLPSKLNSKCSDSYCLGFCFFISSRLKHLPLKSSLFCSILTSPPPGVWAALSSDPILAFAFSLKSSLCCSILTSPPVGLCVVLAREPILAWVSQVTFSSNIYKKGSMKQTRCSWLLAVCSGLCQKGIKTNAETYSAAAVSSKQDCFRFLIVTSPHTKNNHYRRWSKCKHIQHL